MKINKLKGTSHVLRKWQCCK